MTIQALIKKSGTELEEWYIEFFGEIMESEGKAVEAEKHKPEHWRGVYQAHEEQFQEALDTKFKLSIIKYIEMLAL